MSKHFSKACTRDELPLIAAAFARSRGSAKALFNLATSKDVESVEGLAGSMMTGAFPPFAALVSRQRSVRQFALSMLGALATQRASAPNVVAAVASARPAALDALAAWIGGRMLGALPTARRSSPDADPAFPSSPVHDALNTLVAALKGQPIDATAAIAKHLFLIAALGRAFSGAPAAEPLAANAAGLKTVVLLTRIFNHLLSSSEGSGVLSVLRGQTAGGGGGGGSMLARLYDQVVAALEAGQLTAEEHEEVMSLVRHLPSDIVDQRQPQQPRPHQQSNGQQHQSNGQQQQQLAAEGSNGNQRPRSAGEASSGRRNRRRRVCAGCNKSTADEGVKLNRCSGCPAETAPRFCSRECECCGWTGVGLGQGRAGALSAVVLLSVKSHAAQLTLRFAASTTQQAKLQSGRQDTSRSARGWTLQHNSSRRRSRRRNSSRGSSSSTGDLLCRNMQVCRVVYYNACNVEPPRPLHQVKQGQPGLSTNQPAASKQPPASSLALLTSRTSMHAPMWWVFSLK